RVGEHKVSDRDEHECAEDGCGNGDGSTGGAGSKGRGIVLGGDDVAIRCCAVRGWACVRGKGEGQCELGRHLMDGEGAAQHRGAMPQAMQSESTIEWMG